MTNDKHVLSDIMAAALKKSPMTDEPLSRWQKGFNSGVEESAKALEADAGKCDCFARMEIECACGAWDDNKSITSQRAIEIVRALQELM